jgi:hypothetical protein
MTFFAALSMTTGKRIRKQNGKDWWGASLFGQGWYFWFHLERDQKPISRLGL